MSARLNDVVSESHLKSGRNGEQEAAAALNFWQALEYLNPQPAPKPDQNDCIWAFERDAEEAQFPWHAPMKQKVLRAKMKPSWRFQLYAGIINGGELVETARAYLGANELDLSERNEPASAAAVVIDLDKDGYATGQVFVSTVPWAMACLRQSAGSRDRLSFEGWFGERMLEEELQKSIGDLMVELRIVKRKPEPGADEQLEEEYAEELRQITSADVQIICDLVFAKCDWRPNLEEPWRIKALPASDKETATPATQDNPLNSFYAEDIERVSAALDCGNIGAALREYLRGEDSAPRIDLEASPEALIDGVQPALLPPACWPAKHPLVTAQQFAVNKISRLLEDEGIFSVNGPPGTGKTTMLKDIVASIITRRADAMLAFDVPEAAFGKRLIIENHKYPAYDLDESLRGFGIVVSSANNGAVENVSRELPGLKAIDPGQEINYFSIVADSIAAPPKAKQRPTAPAHWGLVSAVLGSKANRSQFIERFWFAGMPKKSKNGEVEAEPDPMRLRSLQDLMRTGEHGALSWSAARSRYREARAHVEQLIQRADAAATAARVLSASRARKAQLLDALVEYEALMPRLQDELDQFKALDIVQARVLERAERVHAVWGKLCSAFARSKDLEDDVRRHAAALPSNALDLAIGEQEAAEFEIRTLKEDINQHAQYQPGFLSQLFRTEHSQRWNARVKDLEDSQASARSRERAAAAVVARVKVQQVELRKLQETALAASQEVANCLALAQEHGLDENIDPATLEQQLHAAEAGLAKTGKAARAAQARMKEAVKELENLRMSIQEAEGQELVASRILADAGISEKDWPSWNLESLPREQRHSVSPYFSQELFDARREVFVAALELHKAFIAAAWSKLSRSLSTFVDVLGGTIHPSRLPGGVAPLWDIFFLVVPLVSSTFASFPRLFTGMGREDLAWLLIDEAGQAAPQLAVGAIWRARRVVVVGDPLQLEPVVSVPDELVSPLLDRCGAEQQWAPPAASAQVLADKANHFGMHMGEPGADETVWLGSPLLVHRRCLDPMFSIANEVAYDGKMVYGVEPDKGGRDFGPSRWIDMPAKQSDGHWIEEQAQAALALALQITGGIPMHGNEFKVYVITPFRKVAQRMYTLLRAEMNGSVDGMVGTVHTFQGKEAEHVILLLGGNPRTPGVISSFAGAKPNLVNVAVTRAKRRLYVIGDRRYWTGPHDMRQIFSRMSERLP